MARVLILGAGLTGLTAAYALRQAGHDPLVLDSAPQPGGAVQSHSEEGWLRELGPNSLLVGDARVHELLGQLRLDEREVVASPVARHRYIVRQGRLVAAPAGPLSFAFGELFSLAAKGRLLQEPWVPQRPAPTAADLAADPTTHDESLAAFVERRLGREFLDYAIAPFVSGIYAGDPRRLSVRFGFPRVQALEDRAGSLVRGALTMPKKEGKPFKKRMISFRRGLGELVEALVEALGPQGVCCGATVERIAPGPGGWQMQWRCPRQSTRLDSAPLLLLTVPAWRLLTLPLPESVKQALGPAPHVDYPPVTSLFLGFRRKDVQHPLDGFGFLCPPVEERKILGGLFSSTLFPGRVPDAKHVALTVFVGGALQRPLGRASLDEQLAAVRPELQRLLGVKADPVWVRRAPWERAIPQYTVGYQRVLDALTETEAAHPGLYFEGNYRRGISVPQCLLAGLDFAARLEKKTAAAEKARA